MTTDRRYHALVRGRQQGPLTREEMVQLAVRGEIGPDTMAWTDGMTIWRPLAEVPGLGNLLADLPATPLRDPAESLLPQAVDSALDRTSRSQAFIIGAGIFFGLIAILGISNIFTFRELALLGFWGSAVLAFFAFRAWQSEEGQDLTTAAMWSVRGAYGAWGLAFASAVFGNWFFAVLQAGAGGLFWLARRELLKQQPEAATGDDHQKADEAPGPADGIRPAADGPATDDSARLESDPPSQDPMSDV